LNSFDDLLLLSDGGWSPQCKVVIHASLVNIIHIIWFVRNQHRFSDKKIHWKTAINLIIANVSLFGNKTGKTACNSISEFSILKAFNITIHPPKAPKIIEALWQPPLLDWIKCNTNGAASGIPSMAACGILFRNNEAEYIGCFAQNLGLRSSLFAELSGAMQAIKIAHRNGWLNLWLEIDSMLVLLAFKSISLVPWIIRNRWDNCFALTRQMNFLVTHIFREGNCCANRLANIGMSCNSLLWMNEIHSQARADYIRNRLGLPYFRLVNGGKVLALCPPFFLVTFSF